MQRRWWLALGLGTVLACAWVAVATPATNAACAKTSLTRVINGKQRCVSASAFRAVRAPASPGAKAFQDAFAGRPIALRQKNGTRVANVISPALAAKAQVAYVDAETDVIAAIRAFAAARKLAVRHGDDVSVTQSADGSISGTVGRTVESNGQSVAMEVEIGARRQGDAFALDLGVKVTVDDGNGTKTSRGFRMKDVGTAPTPTCPTATGAIDLSQHFNVSAISSDTFGSTQAKLGSVHETTTANLTGTAKAQMGPDARLQPFTVSLSADVDYSRSAQVLAFFSGRARAVAKGRLTGTMDPNTGALSGASLTTSAKVSGFPGGTGEAEFRASVEKMLKDETDRIYSKVKDIEKKARAGDCTKIDFAPSSPAELDPNASKNVQMTLETAPGKVTVQTVRWAAVAAKGTATPGTSKAATPTIAVKGASKGPQTASINVKAVSPAGISQGTWVGTSEDVVFPLTYSGTATLESALGPITEKWTSTMTYTRTNQQTNPDGTKQAAYNLTSASVDSHTGNGICTWSTSDTGPKIKAGDIEIRVDAAGKWTSAFLLDLELKSATILCPPAPAAAFTPKSFLQSAGGGPLRPMAAKGPIEATNVSTASSGTASWKLTPGN